MNADDIRFRCSSLGYIMQNDRGGKKMGDSAKTHLVDIFVSAKYGRKEEATGKMLEKGNEREEDSITLLSRVNGRFFKKNDVRLFNDFVTGECDLYIGENVTCAEETIDTKTSWSAHTYFRAQKAELDAKYKWQGVGYMWLTGAKKHTVAYCLVNGTASAIMDEKRRLAYKYIDAQKSEDYLKKARQIEINHIFDVNAFQEENPWFEFDNDLSEWKFDIPKDERVYTFTFDRKEEEIEALKQRVIEARNWMNEHLFKYAKVQA